MNDDIAGDLEWSLRVISGAVNGSLKKYSMYNARSQIQWWSDIISTVVFDWKDCFVMLSVTC